MLRGYAYVHAEREWRVNRERRWQMRVVQVPLSAPLAVAISSPLTDLHNHHRKVLSVLGIARMMLAPI
jgi:hypothetical protein